MSFSSPFKNSPQGQQISQALSPLFGQLQQQWQNFQNSPNGQALSQAFAPIEQAIRQSWSQVSPYMNGASYAAQDWQSPVFNGMNFGSPTVQQQLPGTRGIKGAG